MIELSTNCIDDIMFPLSMNVLGNCYSLKAVVRCASHHFTIALKDHMHWFYVDDLCTTVQRYATFQDLLNNHIGGWYFAVYQKCSLPAGGIDNVPDNQVSCTEDNVIGQVMPTTVNDVAALPLHVEKQIEMPVFDPSQDKHDRKFRINLTKNREKLIRRTVYVKEYREMKQKTETEEEKLAKKLKRNVYMKEYRRKRKNTETETEKRVRKDKQNVYMKEYKKRKLNAADETEKHMQKETSSMKNYTQHNKFENGSVDETKSAPKCADGVSQCNEYPVNKDAKCMFTKNHIWQCLIAKQMGQSMNSSGQSKI